ncbi:hypothetical protein BMS3Bbin10_02377 [bacterium BMS3Bbin10]|nr:hypothetical protein BMS3Bbin10_02377 [bacterium BMS3Bbin10]
MDETIDLCEGKRFRVVMTRAVAKEFKKAEAKERARCKKWMGFYAEDGDTNLDKQKFRFEARLPVGDKKGTRVAVYAFKAWQLRLYGSLIGNTFVVTEIDTSKKSDRADSKKLKSAAQKLCPYL